MRGWLTLAAYLGGIAHAPHFHQCLAELDDGYSFIPMSYCPKVIYKLNRSTYVTD